MTLHVYAGPSLTGAMVPADPALRLLPPIAHGDLYRLRPAPGDAVHIVDGLYQHSPPVRHKEILALCADGIPVFGAGSIGALRAAELCGHGMTGLGTVYGWYASGRLESDADVALLHGDDDIGFRPFTQALVSVIGAVDHLRDACLLDEPAAALVVDVARSIHFTARSHTALRAAAREHGLAGEMDLALATLDTPLGDVKQTDAVSAVHTLLLRHASGGLAGPRVPPVVPDTSYRREWLLDQTPAGAGPDGPTRRQVLAYAQLFLPEFPDGHTDYVLRRLGRAPGADSGERPEMWLLGLSTADLVERGLLTVGEAASLSPGARATRALVRSFRLRPGRLIYEDLPPWLVEKLPDLVDQCSRMLSLTGRTARANPLFHPSDLPAELVDSVFQALWGVDDLAVHVLDRGFRDVEDFRLNARPFLVAARAAVALRTAESSRKVGAHA